MSQELRLTVTETDETGVAYIDIYDCSKSNSMKEEYGMTETSELIITVDGGKLELEPNS